MAGFVGCVSVFRRFNQWISSTAFCLHQNSGVSLHPSLVKCVFLAKVVSGASKHNSLDKETFSIAASLPKHSVTAVCVDATA